MQYNVLTQILSRHIRTPTCQLSSPVDTIKLDSPIFTSILYFVLPFHRIIHPIYRPNSPEIPILFSNVLTQILSRHIGTPTCQLSSPVDTIKLDSA